MKLYYKVRWFMIGLAGLFLVACHPGPPAPLPKFAPVCVGDVGFASSICGNSISLEGVHCRVCETGSGCFEATRGLYCVDRAVGCFDGYCTESPVPFGSRKR